MSGTTQIDSQKKTRRLLVRGVLLVIYLTLMALAFVFGKGHTLLIDNKDSEDGTVKAIENVLVSVNGEEPLEIMGGFRDMAKVRAQWHTLKIDINGQVVEKKIKIPLGLDMALVSIPKLMAGVEPAVIPFVVEDQPPPPEEPVVDPSTVVDPAAVPAAPVAPPAAP